MLSVFSLDKKGFILTEQEKNCSVLTSARGHERIIKEMRIAIEIGGVEFSTFVLVEQAADLLRVVTDWHESRRVACNKPFDRFFDDVERALEDARQD